MERFFVGRVPDGEPILLTGEDFFHAVRVLRMRAGDKMELCDGACGVCTATVEAVEKDALVIRAGQWMPADSEAAHRVTLFQCLPKGDKLELIVQKCVELGVYAIAPVLSERCVALPGDKFASRLTRLQRVAVEAAKQSKRGILPAVLPLCRIADLDFSAFDTVLLAYEDEREQSLKAALRRGVGKNIAIVIGSEGGFSPREAALLKEKGAAAISLGRRILRTETAGMVMLAQLLYEVGQ